jgi:hypothetical protein
MALDLAKVRVSLALIQTRFMNTHFFLKVALGMSLALTVLAPAVAGFTFHVATNGADANPGTASRPFATLERARDAVRALRGEGKPISGTLTVVVHPGIYEFTKPLDFSAEDSGTPKAPVIWRSTRPGEARLVGGRFVTHWEAVTDSRLLERIDPAARGNLWEADLRAQGILKERQPANPPGIGASDPGLELFFNEQPMTIARWPNEDVAIIQDVEGGDYDHRDPKADPTPRFTYDGNRPARWVEEPDVMLHGWWVWDWSDQRVRVKSIDTGKHAFTLDLPSLSMRKKQWFYAYNLLSELDRPGEWYLDRTRGVLYFWPPSPITSGRAMVSLIPNLVTLKETSHLTMRGFVLEACQGSAISIQGGSNNLVAACTIRNLGGFAVAISGGRHNGVTGCDMSGMGDGGVALGGGDEQTLTHCENFADNNLIHHYSRWHPMYRPGIQMIGVGCRASHNLVHHAPHVAISFFGQENVIEYNELHNVVEHANDAGAIYTQPGMDEDWVERGNVVRYNYIHHVFGFRGKGCVGVYLDDLFSSMHCYGNVFYQVPQAVFIGGGRDSLVENNLFIDCKPAIHVDARGLGWCKGIEPYVRKRLAAIPYTQPPWSTRYPELQTILTNNPMAPMGNVFRCNVCWGGRWDDIEAKARPCISLENNLLDTDPHLVNTNRLDFRLRKDSPAWAIGFKPIPMEKAGLYKDPLRASWPVAHPADPAPSPEASR